MAHLFSIWTLQDYEKINKSGDIWNSKKYILKPHAAQIISILRALGQGYDSVIP